MQVVVLMDTTYWGRGFGVMLFNYGRWKISDTNPNKEDPYLILKDNISTPISENIQIGLKYKFNDKLGLYLEVGSSACLIQSGVSLRF